MSFHIFEELSPYSEKELKNTFNVPDTSNVIAILLSSGILKYNYSKKNYSFLYVGLIHLNDYTLFIIPKFIDRNDISSYHLELIFNLLKAYSESEKLSPEELEGFGQFDQHDNPNLLSLMNYIIKDYFNYGLYANQIHNLEWNGDNEIDWQNTIDESNAYVINGTPVYFDFLTTNILNDENDFIRQVHLHVLAKCSEFISRNKLSFFFQSPNITLDTELNELGDKNYILNKITAELNLQYNDRKQLLLKALHSFISNFSGTQSESDVYIFGTKYFHIIWEKVCAFTLGNNETSDFISTIDRPIWKDILGKEYPKDTLKPDIVRTLFYDQKYYILIMDAKYYVISFEKGKLENQPGIGDITKQYLYELALRKKLTNNINYQIRNWFLMPTQIENFLYNGEVSLNFFKTENLQDIKIIKLPAFSLFEKYINKTALSTQEISYILQIMDNH